MALSEKQLAWIEDGLRLAVAAVLAAVRAAAESGKDEPLDWSKLRITVTPEMALEEARNKKSRVRSQESE
jgi:hypothetical protein